MQRRSQTGPWDAELLTDLGADLSFRLPAGVDSVFHLAGFAHASQEPESARLHQAITVQGTARMLVACPASVQRFVYFSSVKAMGESTSSSCVDETCPPQPTTAYGFARLQAERSVLEHARDRHTSVLRLPLVYGPGVKGNLERLLRAACRRRLPLLPDFNNRRSMVHVEDVVSAALAAAQRPVAGGRVYLLCDGQRYSSREIQLSMYRAVGVARPLLRVPRAALSGLAVLGDALQKLGIDRFPVDSAMLAKLAGHACYDAARARAELDWCPQHTLSSALPAMLDAIST